MLTNNGFHTYIRYFASVMKRKINLIVFLMTFCSLLLLGVQLYWNYESFYNNERVFKSQVDEGLNNAVSRLMNIRRDEFANQYKKWLLDTNLIEISCTYSEKNKNTVFSIKDKKLPKNNTRPPFDITLPTFKERLEKITPDAKIMFVNVFVREFLYNDFINGRTLFFTTSLGELQQKAFDKDRVDLKRLTKLYKQELSGYDMYSPFHLKVAEYQFKGFKHIDKDSIGKDYITRPYTYGFGNKYNVTAIFKNVALANLRNMKWLLLSSLILMSITIVCFAYTLKTMLSQTKLGMLKDDFVNNMTHELKTPVATISIAAEAIQDFETNKISANEYLGIIRHQAGKLTQLIDQILTRMLSEQTTITLKYIPVLFHDLILHCLQQYQPQIQLANATITLKLSNKEMMLNGDSAHLSNVIANLLDNALKYSLENPIINISTFEENKYLHFKISNNAHEIPKAFKDKLFDKFFRVPTGNMHTVKGYGLGLSYVAYIVKKHKGNITVESHPSITTFSLILPIS